MRTPCPFCRHTESAMDCIGEQKLTVECLGCGARGPVCSTVVEAHRRWNALGEFLTARELAVAELVGASVALREDVEDAAEAAYWARGNKSRRRRAIARSERLSDALELVSRNKDMP